MKILLVDSQDSFTNNLYDYLQSLGAKCSVIQTDQLQLNEVPNYDGIILSPGPKSPSDWPMLFDLIQEFQEIKPILGVCLGHQAIGEFFGAKLVKAKRPMHGHPSPILFEKHFLFDAIPQETNMMRYHSLVLENIKSPLKIIAQTKENEVMAIANGNDMLLGVQFHPESILSNFGKSLLKNWLDFINKLDVH
jgi:anthranilate synthase/aminodeoxychorismate synthase-like glutamine amidotransferase